MALKTHSPHFRRPTGSRSRQTGPFLFFEMKVNGLDSGGRGEDRRLERDIHASLRQQGPRGMHLERGARPDLPSPEDGASHMQGGTRFPPGADEYSPENVFVTHVHQTSARPPSPCKREDAPCTPLAVRCRVRLRPAPSLSSLGGRRRAP